MDGGAEEMPDEIIEELWRFKDSIAREHGNDVRKLAAYLQNGKRWESGGTLRLLRGVGDVGLRPMTVGEDDFNDNT